jgi:hypothetical protein
MNTLYVHNKFMEKKRLNKILPYEPSLELQPLYYMTILFTQSSRVTPATAQILFYNICDHENKF